MQTNLRGSENNLKFTGHLIRGPEDKVRNRKKLQSEI
jgi:hypothetical protein